MLSRRRVLALTAAGALGVGGLVAYRVLLRRADGTAVMTAPEALAAAAAGEILLVDIRRPDEWRKTGVAQHAVGIDLRDAGFLGKLAAARRSDSQPIAVICARGVRSARMTRRLDEAGLGPLVDIPEGMLGSAAGPGWLARGLPVTQVN